MITIITCSIHPEKKVALEQNIASTIGIPYEFIGFDNRETAYGITKVYNQCASEARYDYLCFVHEDIQFDTQNWGKIIIGKLQEKDCGVIGFAGSAVKPRAISGWGSIPEYTRFHYIQHQKGKKPYVCKKGADENEFSQVIVLDGMCLFSTKKVWQDCRFDETTFPGFHLYDLDFSLQVALKYKNYVCNSVMIEHFSDGAYNPGWLKGTLDFHEKWGNILPVYVNRPNEKTVNKHERFSSYHFARFLIRKNTGDKDLIKKYISDFSQKYPFSFRNLKLYFHYLRKYKLGIGKNY
ncbi:glycosyltransferase [Coprobacter tertius]|uniref:Glycosyltransferase family protein n=1 Tax=Coprobacter tertius TaxID=2944915 RepID=A0ABT1MDB1_9BACT|nr:glycosyltransferase [Coprobacter tertius]MCP9610625.1 glycosyltransferase family protein [Coprobacter tertius]